MRRAKDAGRGGLVKYRRARDSESAELGVCDAVQHSQRAAWCCFVARKEGEVMAALDGLQCALGETETEMALPMRRRAATGIRLSAPECTCNANHNVDDKSDTRIQKSTMGPQDVAVSVCRCNSGEDLVDLLVEVGIVAKGAAGSEQAEPWGVHVSSDGLPNRRLIFLLDGESTPSYRLRYAGTSPL